MNPSEAESTSYMTVEQPQAGIKSVNQAQLNSGDIAASSGNLEKIRDILFGNQIREYDKRFTRIEERLVQECVNLRDETRKRLESLELFIQQEVESLAERLKKQQAEQDAAVRELAWEQRNTTNSLEKKLAQLDEQTAQSDRELRQQIRDQSKNLDSEIRQKYAEILALLERESQELRSDKTDRSALATLFAEIAMRLNAGK